MPALDAMTPRPPARHRPARPGLWVLLAGGLLLGTAPTGPALARPDSLFHQSRPAMGTTFEVYLFAPDRAAAGTLFEAAAAEVERIEATLSTYRPTSELSRINARAAREPVTTDPEVWSLLERAFDLSRRSDGAFDLSVGRLMKAWGFFRGEGRFPSNAELAALPVGWQHVRLDPSARTVAFDRPGLELDPGGIGKGYALDRVAALLRSLGVQRALLGLGGSSFYAIGTPPDEPGWKVRIPDPFDRERTLSTVLLRDASLSTSGSYEKFVVLGGVRYGHIIDPRTRRPVPDRLQVTVIAPRAETSDALSTALFVLGPAEGAALLDATADAQALFVEGPPAAPRIVPLRWNATPLPASPRPGAGS
ncbi:hypothetical protein AWN76_016545 [Rhodothermaceae bacterium RA]|nr:hypothetical protein AWN76_016545 [Rhodothermaceae bacterium RA]